MRIIITFLLLLASLGAAEAATRSWTATDRMPSQVTEQTENVSFAVSDGHVYISLRQRTTVTLFTILGQPVVQDTLPAGTYRFRLPSRGIYLLKIGDITRRITL